MKSESEVTQSCLTLHDPMDCSLPGSSAHGIFQGGKFQGFSELLGKPKVKVTQLYLTVCDTMECIVHGILQARILEWVAVPFSSGSSQPRD